MASIRVKIYLFPVLEYVFDFVTGI